MIICYHVQFVDRDNKLLDAQTSNKEKMLSSLPSLFKPGLKLSVCGVHNKESRIGLGCT